VAAETHTGTVVKGEARGHGVHSTYHTRHQENTKEEKESNVGADGMLSRAPEGRPEGKHDEARRGRACPPGQRDRHS
jgi:hypothetical protein